MGINAGPLDYPLTKKGKREIEYLAKTLSEIKISAIYCSPVFRAVETARILAGPHKLGAQTVEDLTEAKSNMNLWERKEGNASLQHLGHLTKRTQSCKSEW